MQIFKTWLFQRNQLKRVKNKLFPFAELPLDLSQPLLYPMPNTAIAAPMSPLFTLEDRSSVISSDSGLSSSEETDVVVKAAEPPSPPSTPKQPTTVAGRKTASSRSRNSGKKMLPCSFCGKCFDRPSLLNRHLRTHTGERPHVCDICEKGFSTSSSLNTHRRIHSGEKPHECTTCGKRFTASSNLYYHRMTHVKVSQLSKMLSKLCCTVVDQCPFWTIGFITAPKLTLSTHCALGFLEVGNDQSQKKSKDAQRDTVFLTTPLCAAGLSNPKSWTWLGFFQGELEILHD